MALTCSCLFSRQLHMKLIWHNQLCLFIFFNQVCFCVCTVVMALTLPPSLWCKGSLNFLLNFTNLLTKSCFYIPSEMWKMIRFISSLMYVWTPMHVWRLSIPSNFCYFMSDPHLHIVVHTTHFNDGYIKYIIYNVLLIGVYVPTYT